jgi:hypothetical protein
MPRLEITAVNGPVVTENLDIIHVFNLYVVYRF